MRSTSRKRLARCASINPVQSCPCTGVDVSRETSPWLLSLLPATCPAGPACTPACQSARQRLAPALPAPGPTPVAMDAHKGHSHAHVDVLPSRVRWQCPGDQPLGWRGAVFDGHDCFHGWPLCEVGWSRDRQCSKAGRPPFPPPPTSIRPQPCSVVDSLPHRSCAGRRWPLAAAGRRGFCSCI